MYRAKKSKKDAYDAQEGSPCLGSMDSHARYDDPAIWRVSIGGVGYIREEVEATRCLGKTASVSSIGATRDARKLPLASIGTFGSATHFG